MNLRKIDIQADQNVYKLKMIMNVIVEGGQNREAIGGILAVIWDAIDIIQAQQQALKTGRVPL